MQARFGPLVLNERDTMRAEHVAFLMERIEEFEATNKAAFAAEAYVRPWNVVSARYSKPDSRVRSWEPLNNPQVSSDYIRKTFINPLFVAGRITKYDKSGAAKLVHKPRHRRGRPPKVSTLENAVEPDDDDDDHGEPKKKKKHTKKKKSQDL